MNIAINKYISKKSIITLAGAVIGLMTLGAFIGYTGDFRSKKEAPISGMGPSFEPTDRELCQPSEVRPLIKVTIQKPFDQRFPAHRHAKRVYNQVRPKKRVVAARLAIDHAEGGFSDTPKIKKEQTAPETKESRPSTTSLAPSNTFGAMISTPRWSGAAASQQKSAAARQGTRTVPAQGSASQAHNSHQSVHQSPQSPTATAHRHESEAQQGTGQSRPSKQSDPVADNKTEAKNPTYFKQHPAYTHDYTHDHKSDSDSKSPARERKAAKPVAAPKPASSGLSPAIEDILKNGLEQPAHQQDQDLITEPSFSDKVRAGVQTLIEFLSTVSMLKNGWDYIKQGCEWLESTFGIGAWLRSLLETKRDEQLAREQAVADSQPETNPASQTPVALDQPATPALA